MSSQPLRLRKWGNPLPLVASIFFLMYIPGHITTVLKMSHCSPVPERNSVASSPWPWLLGFTFPILSSQSAARAPGSQSIQCPLLPPAFWGALPLDPVSSLRPPFLPFEALPAPHGCFLLCSPRLVYTSLSELMSWSVFDDRWQDSSIFLLYYIHLPGGRNCAIFPFHILQPMIPYGVQSRFSTHIWREF